MNVPSQVLITIANTEPVEPPGLKGRFQTEIFWKGAYAMRAAIESALQKIDFPWIACAERMPEENQAVLYYFERVGVNAGRYHGDGGFGGARGFLTGDVTHWMPLPPPPETT